MYDLPYPPVVLADTVCIAKQIVPGLAIVIKIPPPKARDETYTELVCTPTDLANITTLIKAMAEHGKLTLLLKQPQMRQLGAQIDHVHPIKFLAVVFSDTELKFCMKEIFEDSFKRNGFMDGLGANLSREKDKGKLDQYIEPFAQDLRIAQWTIRPYFQSADWEALVRCLIGE